MNGIKNVLIELKYLMKIFYTDVCGSSYTEDFGYKRNCLKKGLPA